MQLNLYVNTLYRFPQTAEKTAMTFGTNYFSVCSIQMLLFWFPIINLEWIDRNNSEKSLFQLLAYSTEVEYPMLKPYFIQTIVLSFRFLLTPVQRNIDRSLNIYQISEKQFQLMIHFNNLPQYLKYNVSSQVV